MSETSPGPESSLVMATLANAREKVRAARQVELTLEATPTGMLVINTAGDIVVVNAQVEALLGYRRSELIGQPVEMLIPERFRVHHPNLRKSFLAAPSARVMGSRRELCGRRKDGAEVPLEIGISLLPIAGDRFILCSMSDITERKLATARLRTLNAELFARVEEGTTALNRLVTTEDRLRESERKFRLLVDSTADYAIFMLDAAGYVSSWSPGAEKIKGYRAEEVIGQYFGMFYPEDDIADETPRRHLEQAAVLGRLEAQGWRVRKDGTRFLAHVIITAIRGEEATLQGFAKVTRDITEQMRLENERSLAEAALRERTRELSAAKEEADRANAAKSEFLANMSHEIRTPLNAIIGLGYMLEQTTLNADQRQHLRKIQFAGRSLLGVVNNVLDLSKIEAGEMSLEDESFDLPELLRDIGQMLAPQATAKGIELLIRPAPDLPRLLVGDVSRLRQILTNLINNAIKFTDAGHVELNAYCTEQGSERVRLRCEVIDTGIGIEPEALERIFAPFAQADASTTRRYGGTGLGLSIASHLLELMGGEFDVTSNVAVGSKFWFEIPLQIADTTNSTISARGLRVTIVDSGGDAAGGLTSMVRALGWSPQVVQSGEQLLGLLGDTQPNAWPHVLIARINLSDMHARELIARLESECGHGERPSVIMVTDRAPSHLKHQPRMRSSDVLLVQPLTSSALFNAVNAAVSRKPDGREHMLQSTTVDVQQSQWLIGVRVLVVDDSAVNREVAQGILQSQGAIVSTCSDGSAALEYVRTHHQQLDIVLMDVQMPIMDGNEATRLIREELNLKALPVVALTAGALVSERQRALKAGMNDIVTKPFDPQVLIRKVRYLVEQIRGEVIPIAKLDIKQPGHAADEPNMSFIDAKVMHQMFGEDLPLFTSALSMLLRDHAEFGVPSPGLLDEQRARGELQGRVHALRGGAGLIGATHIMRLAAEAEAALEQGRSISVVEPIMAQLTSAFMQMREEAAAWLAEQSLRQASSGAQTAERPSSGAEHVDELCALLDSRNLAALDKFSSLSPWLSETLGAARFGRIRDAVDNLDLSAGAQLLRQAMLATEPAQ